MDAGQIKLILFSLVVGIICLYSAFRRTRQKRQVQDTIRSFTASAPQGLVEMQGFAWPIGTDIIKIHPNTEAVYYYFALQKLVTEGSGKNRKKKWVTVFSQRFGKSFYLMDAKGLAIINIHDSELSLDSNKICSWHTVATEKKNFLISKIITKSVASFPPSNFLFGLFSPSFRIVENEIPVGSPVYARGSFSSRGLENTIIESVGMTLFYQQIYKENSSQLKNLNSLFDENKNNKISSVEAQQGYARIAQIAKRRTLQENIKEKPTEVFGEFIKSEQHPLLVANTHEEHLVDRLGKYLIPLYAGAVCFLSIALITLFTTPEKFQYFANSKKISYYHSKKRQIAAEKTIRKIKKNKKN